MIKMYNFCTLFDSNYSAKGLAMYYSLVKHCSSFCLYIFAFDDEILVTLKEMNLPFVKVISLEEFEDEELLAVKPSRTRAEYSWTCSGSTILYCLEHYNIDSCTYLDADIFFFADPKHIIEEIGNNDVLITEHRFNPLYDQSEISGKYCVQFMTFKNNPNGLKILRWWRTECIKWCYAKPENGKFGDQKYLDDWPTRFTGVHVLQHLGGGVAPWNMQQYKFKRVDGSIIGIDLKSKAQFPVVFFHFHGLQCYKKGRIRVFLIVGWNYLLPGTARHLYNSYLPMLRNCYSKIKQLNTNIDGLAMKPIEIPFHNYYVIYKRSTRLLLSLGRYLSFWVE